MPKSDNSSKRSTPSDKSFSLASAMGLGTKPGFGDPGKVQVGHQNPHKQGKSGASGKGSEKGGVKSKANYDVKTRTHLGGGKAK